MSVPLIELEEKILFSMQQQIENWLGRIGLPAPEREVLSSGMGLLLLVALAWLSKVVAQRLVLRWIAKLVVHTRTGWDNLLVEHKFFSRLAHLAPALVLDIGSHFFLHPEVVIWVRRLALLYMGVVGLGLADAILNILIVLYERKPANRGKPIKGYVQTVKIFLVGMVAIWGLAMLMGKSPWGLLSGIGALSAVLLLVFKDSILGLVASIQISAYNMIEIGDWIEMPKYNADGDVLDISLHTIKVQNWDKTITTIPTHALIEDSFKNWRGMQRSGGRRIKRALHIDMSTIRFCDAAMLERFGKMHLVSEYVRCRQEEIARYNRQHGFEPGEITNGRRMTNIGTFRAWVEAFLRQNAKIHQQMTFLVRQLAPSETGLPIEIYVFTNDTNWVNYEAIQADIFDHILAATREFGLSVFQAPSGRDVQVLGRVAGRR